MFYFLFFLLILRTKTNIPFDPKAIKSLDMSKYWISHVPSISTSYHIDYLDDVIKSQIGKRAEWESFLRIYIQKYARPDSVAIDIGSHCGIHSMNMARAVGKKGKVIAFEPQKKLYAEQYYNLILNNLSNIVTFRLWSNNEYSYQANSSILSLTTQD